MCVLSILLSVLTDFAVTLYKGCSRAANLGQLAPDSGLPHSLSLCSQAGCYSLFFFPDDPTNTFLSPGILWYTEGFLLMGLWCVLKFLYFDKDPWVVCALPVYFSMSLVWSTEIVSFILRPMTRVSEGEGEGRHRRGERGKHSSASMHGSSKRLRSPWFKLFARGQQLRSYLTRFFVCHLGDVLSIWDKGIFWERATDDRQRFGANRHRDCRRVSEEAQPQLTSSLLALKVPGCLQQILVGCLKSVPLSVSPQPALDH